MLNEDLNKALNTLPPIETIRDTAYTERVIHLHLMDREVHWYVAAYDPDRGTCFGFIRDGTSDYSRWLDFLLPTVAREVSWDRGWIRRRASDVSAIARGYGSAQSARDSPGTKNARP
jgi:hypothetical protein